MIDPENTKFKYCIVNNTDTQIWWKEIMLPKEYNLYVAFRCWVQFVRCNKIVGVLWRIVYIEWYMNTLQYEQCKVRAFGSPVARFTAGQSLPPGFRAARQCFCCKEVVIAHVRVARPLSTNLYFKEEREEKKSFPLRMITGSKECRTEIFRQICARTSKFFFNKQTRHSN